MHRRPGASPTLKSPTVVGGSVIATAPVWVVISDSSIVGDIRETGGGGGAFSGPGAGCTPTGIFAAFMSPVFSDYEDSTIGGNLSVSGLSSCWLGSFRDKVGGSVSFVHNTMADPDAMEVLTNRIQGNLICSANSPGNQYGDSMGMPNVVGGFAVGQCGSGGGPEPGTNPRPAPDAGRSSGAHRERRHRRRRAMPSAPPTGACSPSAPPSSGLPRGQPRLCPTSALPLRPAVRATGWPTPAPQ